MMKGYARTAPHPQLDLEDGQDGYLARLSDILPVKGEETASRLVLVDNWFEELRRQVPN